MKTIKTLTIIVMSLISIGAIPASAAGSADMNGEKTYNVIMPRGEDTCGAERFLKEMQADKSFLAKAQERSKTDPNLRIVTGNQAVTMDFRAERLTVYILPEKGLIRLGCN